MSTTGSHEVVPDISVRALALRALEQPGSRATRIGVEMAAELVAEASPLVQGAVLALPTDDARALDVLRGALP